MSAEVNVDFKEDVLVQRDGAQLEGFERAGEDLSAKGKMVRKD